MRPVDISEIKNIADYEIERETWRPQVIALKAKRRVQLGRHLTFLFENHDTVRYQVQEMARTERLVRPNDIAHEVATYNELIPAPGELSATLLIEYETPVERDVKLRELLGLEKHLWMEVVGAGRTQAVFDDRQVATHRISAVQYVKFRLSPEQQKEWSKGVRLVADHPAYQAKRALNEDELAELASDFVE